VCRATGADPFDLVFVDADKPGYAGYLSWAMRAHQARSRERSPEAVGELDFAGGLDVSAVTPYLEARRRP
jgi:hypothetical protein